MNYIQGEQAEKVQYAEFQFFCTHHNQLNRARLIIVGSIFPAPLSRVRPAGEERPGGAWAQDRTSAGNQPTLVP